MHHRLEAGGEHTEQKHFRLMSACAELCRRSAHFMLIGNDHHQHLRRECADDCKRIGDMGRCVEAASRPAGMCRIVPQDGRVAIPVY